MLNVFPNLCPERVSEPLPNHRLFLPSPYKLRLTAFTHRIKRQFDPVPEKEFRLVLSVVSEDERVGAKPVHSSVDSCRRDGRVAEGARLESVFRGNSNVGSNPTLSASLFSIVYEHRFVLACNGVQRECNVAWPSTSIDATARNVKAPTPKTLEPASLKKDGADGKNARA